MFSLSHLYSHFKPDLSICLAASWVLFWHLCVWAMCLGSLCFYFSFLLFLFLIQKLYLVFKEQLKGRNYMVQLAFIHYLELGEENLMVPFFRLINLTSPVKLLANFILDLLFWLSQSLLMMWGILNWNFTWFRRQLSLLFLPVGKFIWTGNRYNLSFLIESFFLFLGQYLL